MSTFIGPLDEDEQEWNLDWFMADCERVEKNPPTPPAGIELVECDAEPRHWPMYLAHVEGMYPGPCLFCQVADYSKRERRAKCEAEHRRWKSWKGWSRIASRLYVLGITSSGGGTSFGRCEFCGIGRQEHAPHWRGKRSYILGVKRETWTCLWRGHRRTEHRGCGLCTICLPCSQCGSTDVTHVDGIDCETAADIARANSEAQR